MFMIWKILDVKDYYKCVCIYIYIYILKSHIMYFMIYKPHEYHMTLF